MNAKEANIREQILFGQEYSEETYDLGGIRNFDLTFDQAKKLIENGFLEELDQQNFAPTAGEFVDFMMTHNPDNWRLTGYAVSPKRKDVRISIDGIRSVTPLTEKKDIEDFFGLFRTADEFEFSFSEPVRCWFD